MRSVLEVFGQLASRGKRSLGLRASPQALKHRTEQVVQASLFVRIALR
jgi:hypothetical protein